VRASGASQQAFVNFLGGSPITMAFAEIQPALASGVVDGAITGAFAGFRSRWHESARFIAPMPVNFGLVAHFANLRWWNGLDGRVRAVLETELRGLGDAILARAKTKTATGIACNTGTGPCPDAPASMRLVPLTAAAEALRKRAFAEAILPAFAQRRGAACVATWHATIGKLVGATSRAP
jgi:hypothetical protein